MAPAAREHVRVARALRDRVTVYEAEDWDKRIRRYYDEHPRGWYRVVQPIPG